MRSTALALQATIAVALASTDASACPACNIHNYLTASVHTSNNIFVGKIVSAVGKDEAMVEIITVLRGTGTVGDRVQRDQVWDAAKHIGEKKVFSDPRVFGPDFPRLPGSFEDEIAFLTGFGVTTDRESVFELGSGDIGHLKPNDPRPVIKDVAEAIRRAQGYSNESRQMGLEYLLALPVPQTRLIIEAIEERRQQGDCIYEVQCLAQALLLKPTPRVQAYALNEVSRLLNANRPAIDWNAIPTHPSEDSHYLAALLGYAGDTWSHSPFAAYQGPKREPLKGLIDKQRAAIVGALRNLNELALADTVFALCGTQTMSPAELRPLLKDSTGKNGFALGMLFLAKDRSSLWDSKGADKAFQDARDAAEQPQLKALIQKTIDKTTTWGTTQ